MGVYAYIVMCWSYGAAGEARRLCSSRMFFGRGITFNRHVVISVPYVPTGLIVEWSRRREASCFCFSRMFVWGA